MRGWIVRIAIIGVIALGGLIFRDRLSGNAGDLAGRRLLRRSGRPTEIKDVQHHPCTRGAHGARSFALVKHPAAKGAPLADRGRSS